MHKNPESREREPGEITGELVMLSPRGGAVPGTVIMLGSAVMLGVESVAHYAAEWKKCRNIIKHELGDVVGAQGIIMKYKDMV